MLDLSLGDRVSNYDYIFSFFYAHQNVMTSQALPKSTNEMWPPLTAFVIMISVYGITAQVFTLVLNPVQLELV